MTGKYHANTLMKVQMGEYHCILSYADGYYFLILGNGKGVFLEDVLDYPLDARKTFGDWVIANFKGGCQYV